jgi:hypothetical protein
MAKKPASTSDLNALHSKFAKALNAALDGEVDSDGVVKPPAASLLSVVRAFLSDSNITPATNGDDQIERMKSLYASLPFTDTDEQGIPTTHEKAKH